MKPISSKLLNQLHQQIQTIGNNANPKMNIQVSRAKETIQDSDYWTVETIRVKDGIGDLSVATRRQRPYGPPDRIYNIYVDSDGIVKTAYREYPDKELKKWQYQFDVGNGISCAIVFDQHWERYKKKWRAVTDNQPWLFWVDTNNILYGQLWDDVNTRVQIDTNTSKVRAIRAWKNVNVAEKDQGVVVGYVKTDGTAWYRNYCQQADYSYVWEPSRRLTQFTGTAVNMNMFLTNDYRMGFIIEDENGQIYWLITPRNWAGMGFEDHTIPTVKRTSIETNLIPITYLAENNVETLALDIISQIESRIFNARITNEIIEAYNIPIILLDGNNEEYEDWGYKIRFKTLYEFDDILKIELVDSYSGYSYGINVTPISLYRFEIEVIDGNVTNGFNNTRENLIVRVTNAKNPAGYAIQDFEYSFTPINLVPENIPPPEVEAIWNE